jgi:PPOX class probable F420-dependent enzyme
VARLATAGDDGWPHIVPITLALDADHIYTAVDAKAKTTTDLKRLRNIRANPRVAVLADHYDEDWAALWWVRADGNASVIEAPDDMAAPLRLLAARYPQYSGRAPQGPVISIEVIRWTGWAAQSWPVPE